MTALPAPLTPPGCDVSAHRDMPLNVDAFRYSKLNGTTNDAAWRAGVLLMCAAWSQPPAGSVPDDDGALAALSGLGRGQVRVWRRLKAAALVDWRLCADGRWYHPQVARAALGLWIGDLVRSYHPRARRSREDAAAIVAMVQTGARALDALAPNAPELARARRFLAHRDAERLAQPIPLNENEARRMEGGRAALAMLKTRGIC